MCPGEPSVNRYTEIGMDEYYVIHGDGKKEEGARSEFALPLFLSVSSVASYCPPATRPDTTSLRALLTCCGRVQEGASKFMHGAPSTFFRLFIVGLFTLFDRMPVCIAIVCVLL